ncbi:hypothetical protein ANSO36C_50300 [Nostoc cf. commune SO-36]|uniref:Uncharacterized protein n=1 Tax=Nostoc cf. commune SO-36 TaxID=449208 RepID=A0ABN6Q7S3_NOSCO|nr:hypothetical protein ANSO36C_50300 [Nostoc cf. commune SO-36]
MDLKIDKKFKIDKPKSKIKLLYLKARAKSKIPNPKLSDKERINGRGQKK